ncbi:hypothetical protein [Halobaculum sp. MBLA0143]|uniref:hypothetical protein n=1 Tax=Halobaculum sp. MBLA0143 TaxID=3079933 RepID=UPI00352530F2
MDELLAALGTDVGALVRGAARLDLPGLRSEAHVLARAVRRFFREHDRLREAAAVQRHCSGAATDADLLRLAGRRDPTAVADLRATHADAAGPTVAPCASLGPVAAVDRDVPALAVGAASLRWRDAVAVVEVLDGAVVEFFDAHETVRHAAAAQRYAASRTMTRGGAARLADVPRGEIRTLLRDHGVTPWKGGVEGGTGDDSEDSDGRVVHDELPSDEE